METSPAESITGVLQATVYRVCQQIIPYSKELVVSGVITIEADGNEFCKFDIKQSSDKERPPSRLQLISQALDKTKPVTQERPPSAQDKPQTGPERPPSRQERPSSRQGRPPSRQCTRPSSRQQKDSTTDSSNKDEPKPRSSSRLAAKGKSPPEKEKTGLPKPIIAADVNKNLSGNQSSLVNTLVAEAMKLWYDEGPSPDRLNEIRESDPHRSAAAELSLEAVRQWGQISPETLEAAAQLRRLGEQAAALVTMNQNHQALLTPVSAQPPTKPEPITRAEPLPKLNFNEPVKMTRPRRRKGKANLKENEAVETTETPMLPQKPAQPRRHRFQSEAKEIPIKNSKGMYECPECGKEFTFSTNLTRHQRNFHGRPFTRKTKDMKHGGDSDNFSVDYNSEGSKESTSSSKLSRRSKNCYVCAICFDKFDTEKLLDDHQNTAHSDNSMDEDSLNVVTKENQSESPTGSVEGSRRRSPRSSVIASREKRKGDVEKASPNDDAAKKTRKSKKGGQDIIVIDAENSPTPSDTSSRKSTPPKMYVKMEDEDDLNNIKYSCTFCGRSFPLYRNLGRHLKCTHGVSIVDSEMQGLVEGIDDGEQKGAYVCSVCGHGFSFSSNLSRHMSKVHHYISQKDPKPRGKSGRGEASKENEPSNIHSSSKNEDRFGCDLCGARFTFSSNLSRHMKRTHKMVRKVVDTSPIVIQDEGDSRNGNHKASIIATAQPDPAAVQRTQSPPPVEVGTLVFEVSNTAQPKKAEVNSNTETSLPVSVAPATIVTKLAPAPLPAQVPVILNPVHTTAAMTIVGTVHQAGTPLSVRPGIVTLAPTSGLTSLLPKTTIPMLMSQPQSLFRPISFGPGPAPVMSAGYFSSHLPKPDISPSESVSDLEVADTMCQRPPSLKKEHVCRQCGQEFSFQPNLLRHINTIHGPGDGGMKADQTLKLNLSLAPPMCKGPLPPLPNVTSVPLIVPVPLQPISFSSPMRSPASDPLLSPLLSPQDGKQSRHICNICNASFTFRTNLTRHMKKQHGQVPPSEMDAIGQQGAEGGRDEEGAQSPDTPPLVIDSPPGAPPLGTQPFLSVETQQTQSVTEQLN